MNEIPNCPNCTTPLKNSLLKSNNLLTEGQVAIINFANNSNTKIYCNKCGNDLLAKAKSKVEDELENSSKTLRKTARLIPVITTHNPYNWEYTVLGMVTGQSTTGTGIFSEWNASVADLFGDQSSSYNNKLKGGETLCFDQLRGQAINMGGNAVIATDIDYSEVGGGKGMLMVCMAGTVVKLRNLNILQDEVVKGIQEIEKLQDKIKQLSNLKKNSSN